MLVRVADYVELTKPRIATLGAGDGCRGRLRRRLDDRPIRWLLFNALVGTALVAASASALNQWLERCSDARMERTADRPLPGGRLGSRGSSGVRRDRRSSLGFGLSGRGRQLADRCAGTGHLVYLRLDLHAAQARHAANTAVGAVAGALPVLMGWAAVGAKSGAARPLRCSRSYSSGSFRTSWPSPGFIAINMRRPDCRCCRWSIRAAAARARRPWSSALALVPVSLMPAVLKLAGGVYFGWALLWAWANWLAPWCFCSNWTKRPPGGCCERRSFICRRVLLLLMLSAWSRFDRWMSLTVNDSNDGHGLSIRPEQKGLPVRHGSI